MIIVTRSGRIPGVGRSEQLAGPPNVSDGLLGESILIELPTQDRESWSEVNIRKAETRAVVTVVSIAISSCGCSGHNEVLISYKWPLSVVVISFLIMLIFRRQLSELLNRITRIDRSGISADSASTSQQNTRETNRKAVESLLAETGSSPVLDSKEQFIRKNLQEKGIEIQDGSVETMLIRHLALTQTVLEFEQIYYVIWGSQIAFLKTLNSARSAGLDSEFLIRHFEYAKTQYPLVLGAVSVERYSGYLLDQGLVNRREGRFYITDFGLEFLLWMTRNGRVEAKSL